MRTVETRVVKGWRSRLQDDLEDARSAVWDAPWEASEFREVSSPFCKEAFESPVVYSHPIKKFGIERQIATAALKELRRRQRVLDRADWSQEEKDFDRERKQRYWMNLTPEKHQARITRMVVYNRDYRQNNREKVNAWARDARARDQGKGAIAQKAARAARTPEVVQKERFQAACFGQFLALAGLASWQKTANRGTARPAAGDNVT